MANFKVLPVFATIFILTSALCGKNSNTENKQLSTRSVLPECTLSIKNDSGRVVTAIVEVALRDADRQKGLMFRKTMPQNHGMLFVFDYEQKLHFWMKNTFLHLDIAYLSGSGVIHETYYMKPLDISITYPSKKPALYALEMNAGWFKKNNISPGRRVVFNGCFGK